MCWSLEFLEWIVLRVIGVIFFVALIKIWLPLLLTYVGWAGGAIAATIRLIIWLIVATLVVVVLFSLFECALGGGAGLGSLFFHR
jgi:hypothetical protein